MVSQEGWKVLAILHVLWFPFSQHHFFCFLCSEPPLVGSDQEMYILRIKKRLLLVVKAWFVQYCSSYRERRSAFFLFWLGAHDAMMDENCGIRYAWTLATSWVVLEWFYWPTLDTELQIQIVLICNRISEEILTKPISQRPARSGGAGLCFAEPRVR